MVIILKETTNYILKQAFAGDEQCVELMNKINSEGLLVQEKEKYFIMKEE